MPKRDLCTLKNISRVHLYPARAWLAHLCLVHVLPLQLEPNLDVRRSRAPEPVGWQIPDETRREETWFVDGSQTKS